ncbi:hypothetical protein, partial [Paenibacillus herberti]
RIVMRFDGFDDLCRNGLFTLAALLRGTTEGAKQFARMRSVISTIIKQKLELLPSLVSALSGKLRLS